jgi:uncharacterized membrane protein
MFQNLEKLAVLLAFLGILISGYLLYARILGSAIVCGLSSCGIVNGSSYALFLGLPVSLLGLGFYLALIFLLLTKKFKLFFLATLAGVLFSAYLTYLEAFVIHAWCQWCILSAWISVSLFIISIRLKKSS